MALYKFLTTDDVYTVPANGAKMNGRSFGDPQIRVLDADGSTYHWGSVSTFTELDRTPGTGSTDSPVTSISKICFPGGSTITMSDKASVWISLESI